jgi:hypothetical protein
MKVYYARPEKDRTVVKEDGGVLLYAFEKYMLGKTESAAYIPTTTFISCIAIFSFCLQL